ncbi:MAG: hypothetical protein A3K19_02930 [Lentisphaerae bacterium RIFOXYB12_FULL_65_16]|nr:MAG: hypothetical protein A3K18_19980 [Lentisphaerae bacterium RIFOXYA12_64_32]OGV92306.1 MAG: hypothetical protein A3K19_02930 [Lentisphaerae bacterium RIFOXYB12_FULL_65_16]
MNRWYNVCKVVAVTVTALVAALTVARCRAADAPAPAGLNSAKNVFVLPVEGPIDKSMLFVFRRAFKQAKATQPAAVIVMLDTPGGTLRETEEIIAWMRSIKVPTYAFVNPRALSAGAIISLGTDAIFMSPGSTIGSAMPILINPIGGGVEQLPPEVMEKMLSAVRAMVRGLAQENGYSTDLAVAMVDPKVGFKVGDHVVCPPGQLLNLTAKEAIEIIPPMDKPLLARAMVSDIPSLLEQVDLKGANIVRFEEEAADRLARYITMIGPLLLALGVLCLYIEFKTPGFGLPGIAGISLLLVYFFGHFVAGLAGIEDIFLVLVGFILLAVEVFLLPGFGVIGMLGILCMLGGIIMGLVPHVPTDMPALPDVPPLNLTEYVRTALEKFLVSAALGAVGIWALSKVLPKTPMYRQLVLQKTLTQEAGFVSSDSPRYKLFVGHVGVAETLLRPAGTATIEGQRLDVVSSGDYIPKGARVCVIQTEGGRVVVERVPDTPAPPGETAGSSLAKG